MPYNIRYDVRIPTSSNGFPSDLSVSELEEKMQGSFATRSMIVMPEYFIKGSNTFPKSLSYFILPRDKDVISTNNGHLEGSLVGALIATEESIGNFEFTYYDKIFVIPDYEKNGIMRTMLKVARSVSDGKKVIPALLRTSSQELDKRYVEQSDIQVKLDNWYIRGFGFLDKKTEAELFKNAKDMFYLASRYVASKPRTVFPIETSISQ